MKKAAPAVFLDRDGVLVQSVMRDGKISSPRNAAEFALIPDLRQPLEALAQAGFLLFVVTNQPDLARKNLTQDTLNGFHGRLMEAAGGPHVIHKIYVCPHDNSDACACRKPAPGMLLEAAKEWDVDLTRSYLVGDREVDMRAGKAAGCKTVLMSADYNRAVRADFVAGNLADAARWIHEDR